MIENWIAEIKKGADFTDLGMILVHNGLVRATSKLGKPVKGMRLSYNQDRLNLIVDEIKKRDGIIGIRVWINQGTLKVGDDIMYALVAGRFRTIVIPVLEELVSRIKNEVVTEDEF